MTPFLAELEQLFQTILTRAGLWQAGLLLVSFALAWFLARAAKSRVPTGLEAGRLKLAAGGFHRVAYPLLALTFVWIGKVVLDRFMNTALLKLAVPLLMSFAAIRLLVYLLRHLIPPSPFLKASERIIAYLMWATVALYLMGLLPELRDALNDISFSAGKQKITLLMILSGLVSVLITMMIAMTLARMLEGRIMAETAVNLSLRMVLSKLLRAVALLVAVLIALPMVGIDLTVLSVFGGAIGVGLGFGLQKVASNYVCGFIILLERSVRVGDMVTVDGKHGKVTHINGRYTVLRSLDGTEFLLPNEMLITGTVINHTYTDPSNSVKIPLAVAYSTSMEEVDRILLEEARAQSRVLADPPPGVLIRNLGDNGIELELVVWIRDPDQGQGTLRSDLYRAVLRRFQASGIEVPYPQREVRVLATAPAAPAA
jgi:small-conductance mechanosensitive channel